MLCQPPSRTLSWSWCQGAGPWGKVGSKEDQPSASSPGNPGIKSLPGLVGAQGNCLGSPPGSCWGKGFFCLASAASSGPHYPCSRSRQAQGGEAADALMDGLVPADPAPAPALPGMRSLAKCQTAISCFKSNANQMMALLPGCSLSSPPSPSPRPSLSPPHHHHPHSLPLFLSEGTSDPTPLVLPDEETDTQQGEEACPRS